MKKALKRVEAFDKKTKCWNVFVETPKGSRVKYSFDEEIGFLTISKTLPEGMVFPFNFGFIPKTLGEDGDPLDVLILNEEPLVSGCLVKVKPIAIIKAEQADKKKMVRNDRIIAQAIAKEAPEELQQLELKKEMVRQIEIFFRSYNEIYGQKFRVVGTGGPKKAVQTIKRGLKLAKKKA